MKQCAQAGKEMIRDAIGPNSSRHIVASVLLREQDAVEPLKLNTIVAFVRLHPFPSLRLSFLLLFCGHPHVYFFPSTSGSNSTRNVISCSLVGLRTNLTSEVPRRQYRKSLHPSFSPPLPHASSGCPPNSPYVDPRQTLARTLRRTTREAHAMRVCIRWVLVGLM